MPRTVLYANAAGPPLAATLKDAKGQPIPLTGHTVAFAARLEYGTATWTGVATVTDALAGEIEYQPTAADLAGKPAGVWVAQWIIDSGTTSEQVVEIPDKIELRQNLTDAPAQPFAATYALCTLAQAKQTAALDELDPTPDLVLQRYVNAASRMMIGYAGREFAPPTTGQTRSFTVAGSLVVLTPSDLRAATSVVAVTGGATPVQTTLTLDDYTVTLGSTGTATSLPLTGHTSLGPVGRGWWADGTRVDVTGDWGFAVVPDDVAEMCAEQAASWFRRNQQARTGLSAVDAESVAPSSLPTLWLAGTIRAGLDARYRVPVAA